MSAVARVAWCIFLEKTMVKLETFDSPEYNGQIENLPRCQVLNDKTSVGLFIKEKSLTLCGWNGEAPNYTHTFNSGKEEKGILLPSPKLHILGKSHRYVEERNSGQILGDYETPSGQALYQHLKDEETNPTLRTFYLIYVLGDKNETLHPIPLILSIHGVAAARFGEAYNAFKIQMELAWMKNRNKKGYRSLNWQFHTLCVFQPTFTASLEPPEGKQKSWVATIHEVTTPTEPSKDLSKFICLEKDEEIWAIAGSNPLAALESSKAQALLVADHEEAETIEVNATEVNTTA